MLQIEKEVERDVIIMSLQKMPERISWDELMERIILLKKILIGLQQLENGEGISLEEAQKRTEQMLKERQENWGFGSMPGLVKYMAPDFNEPLEDFKDYM